MTDYQTTMKDLIIGVRYMLSQEAKSTGKLPLVRQIKRGVLPLRPIYPCITIIPNYEMITQYRSGRMAMIEREVLIHCLVMDMNGKDGISMAQDTAEKSLTILRDDIHVTDQNGSKNTASVTFGDMDFNEGYPIDGAGLYNVSFGCRYLSLEQLPDALNTYRGNITNNVSSDTLNGLIHSHLAGKKSTTLSMVKKFERDKWGPNAAFPRVLVTNESESQRQEKRGIDVVYSHHVVTIESLVGTARDSAMDFHLSILEPVKDALEERTFWSGNALNSTMGNITFDAIRTSGKPVYQTRVRYEVQIKDSRVE